MLEMLWGLKTVAIFDVWTLEHILSGLSIGHSVKKNNKKVFWKRCGIDEHAVKTQYFDYIGILFLAYLWETIEHYLEMGLAGEAVANWFQGVEFWPNRIIADPLMLVLGYHIARRHPEYVIPARIMSVMWLFLHIFIFPNSMYLHQIM